MNLPSSLDSAHATLDSLTGTLLVQGGVTAAGVSQSDAIVIDAVSSDIRVRLYDMSGVNYATEQVPAADVTQIVVSRTGDNISDPGSLVLTNINVPVKEVYWVVSSNEDALDPGPLAWNLKSWWAFWLPEDGRWWEEHQAQKHDVLRMEFKTFLNAFIKIPCQIVRSRRKLIYRVLTYNSHLPVFFRLCRTLRC